MDIDIQYRPANTVAKISLGIGESFTAEAGAMIAMNDTLSIETTTHKKNKGNFFKAIKRMFAGESFFLNQFEATSQPGEIWLATSLPGDMTEVLIDDGKTLIVQSGSYVASESDITMDVGWQGFKSLLSGERFFWLRLSGQGRVILSSYGTIYPIKIDGQHIVDTGHIVAFEETLNFSISKAGRSWWSSFLGGEGLVCKFFGKGTVWCQSHNANAFGSILGPMLKSR